MSVDNVLINSNAPLDGMLANKNLENLNDFLNGLDTDLLGYVFNLTPSAKLYFVILRRVISDLLDEPKTPYILSFDLKYKEIITDSGNKYITARLDDHGKNCIFSGKSIDMVIRMLIKMGYRASRSDRVDPINGKQITLVVK